MIFNKIKLLTPIFLPILLSTIFHFSFANYQKESDYSSLVLFLSVISVISTLLLLGKELQYYQCKNLKITIKKDFFTLQISSFILSFGLFLLYTYKIKEFSFSPLWILFAPLKVTLDYFVIVLNVLDKAKFVRYTFDILFGMVQIFCLLLYVYNLIDINILIIIFLIYFLLTNVTYLYVLRINLLKIDFNYKFTYFKIGKAMISGLGSFVAKFQFIIMSIVSPEIIGIANIAFTISNTISVPYNYISKLNLPFVLKNKSLFNQRFQKVRNSSILFSIPIVLSIGVFIIFNPIKLKYFENELFYYFLIFYLIASFTDILVGLKSSLVQILGEEKKLIYNLIIVLLFSVLISFIDQSNFQGMIMYVSFVIFSNIFFNYKFKQCFKKDYQ